MRRVVTHPKLQYRRSHKLHNLIFRIKPLIGLHSYSIDHSFRAYCSFGSQDPSAPQAGSFLPFKALPTGESGRNNLISIHHSNSQIITDFVKDNDLTPVFIYENLHSTNIRNKILQETKGLSGIYLILNKITLDFYIGSASTGKFNARFTSHLIYLRGSKIVKHAINKYKLSNFAFLILELFPEVVNKENNKQLLDREDFYLKTMLPNYNILTEAGSSFGYKHTELDRIKMKSNYSLERRLQIGNLNRNKTLRNETIEKIREKALSRDRTKIHLSEQSILNMKKNSKPIILYNLDRTVFGQYKSITEAAYSIKCSIKTIYRALKTDKNLLIKRFIVKYDKDSYIKP